MWIRRVCYKTHRDRFPDEPKKTTIPGQSQNRGFNFVVAEILDHVLEFLGRFESYRLRGADLDGFACLWVTPRASLALLDQKRPKTDDLAALVLPDTFLDGAQDGIHGSLRAYLRLFDLCGDHLYEVSLIHGMSFRALLERLP